MNTFLFVSAMVASTLSYSTDYSKAEKWAALPGRTDNADWVPEGLSNMQDSARADVFFIHPTTDVTGLSGNAGLEDKAVNNRTDDLSMKYQASVFNNSCRVFAPRYRQAALNNFFSRHTERSKKAFDLAYQDVREAFDYYLKNYNNGRPVVIAGHSQGSMHAVRLLQEYFDGTPLQHQLVEAYLIGYPVHQNQLNLLKVSDSSTHFGGYVSYCTFGMDADVSFLPEYNHAVVVNPLSWSTDKSFVSAEFHLGGLSKKWNGIRAKLCGAKIGNGILEIQKPSESGFAPLAFKNYHMYDYPLFYMNIRQNVEDRLNAYLKQH